MSDTCHECNRPKDVCDDADDFEDRWNYATDSHYTVQTPCPGAVERAGCNDEPDFEQPNDDLDEAACFGGVEWP